MDVLDGMPQLRSGTGGTPKEGGCVIQVVSYLWNGEWTDATPCVHPVLRSAAIRVNDSVDDETRQKLYPLIPRLMDTAIEDATENKRVSVGLAIWCAERVFELVRPQDQAKARAAIDAARAWFECRCDQHAYAAAAAAATTYATAAYAGATTTAATTTATAAAAYAAAAAAAATTYATAATAATTYAAAAYTTTTTTATATAAAATTAAARRYDLLVGLLDEYDRLTGRTDGRDVSTEEWESVRCAMGVS